MLIRILLLFILVMLLGRAIRTLLAGALGAPPPGQQGSGPPRGVQMVRDPVCGTFLPPSHALAVPRPDGAVMYFCSETCRQEYVARERHG
ncbi:MAG: hypothetical protein H6Q10_1398 [Acidobacteria bacterium]|nr:hypothetical protein [Acidobacteriota bacterium]